VTVPAGATVATFTVKTYDVTAPATFNITATYPAGYTKKALLTVGDPTLPKASLKCPSSGAMFPPNHTLTVSADVSDDQGISKVEFYLDGATIPFATSTSAPFQTAYTVPQDKADGYTFTLKAKAYDAEGKTAEALSSVTVVTGDVISADTTIAAGDVSHDGHTLIVASGTTTIVGAHSFARLVVLSGAKLTHPPDSSSAVGMLDLTVAGPVYVACAGAMDVSGIGYLGGDINGPGQAYPNQPGSQAGSGGSHGGLGGDDLPNLAVGTYGSFALAQISPELAWEAGGGGGGTSDGVGGIGGGVVRLVAGQAVVDGSVLADGSGGARRAARAPGPTQRPAEAAAWRCVTQAPAWIGPA
jgi:hypothetical protein